MAGVLEIDRAAAGEGLAGAAGAGGQDAVEHVDAAGDGTDQVGGLADAHEVARAIVGQQRAGRVERGEHELLRLAHGQAADRVAVEADLDQALGRARSLGRVGAALDDAEQAVARSRDEGRLGARGPAQGQLHGAGDLGLGRRQGDALVEHHGDGRIQQVLDLDRALGRELVPAAVMVRAEDDAAAR